MIPWAEQDMNVVVQWDTKESTAKVKRRCVHLWKWAKLLCSDTLHYAKRQVSSIHAQVGSSIELRLCAYLSSTERSPCQPDTCENGGTCFETQSGFKCLCREGYSGKSCSGNRVYSQFIGFLACYLHVLF